MAKVKLEAVISATAKGLKDAMEKAKASVQDAARHMKQSISGIGDSLTDAGKKSESLSKQLGQAGGKLTGMVGKVGIIVAGFRALGKMVNDYLIDPIVNATKRLAEFQQMISRGAGENAKNVSGRMSKENAELKKFLDLLEKYNSDKSNVNKVALQQQQQSLSKNYGIDINSSNYKDILKEQFEHEKNMRLEALKSEETALKAEQSTVRKRQRGLERGFLESGIKNLSELPSSFASALKSYRQQGKGLGGLLKDLWSNRDKGFEAGKGELASLFNNAGELESNAKRQDEISKRLTEIANERNTLGKETDFTDAMAMFDAKAADKQKQLDAEVEKGMKEYANVVEQRAKAAKDAYRAHLEAERKLQDAEKALADAIRDNAEQEAQDARDKRRRNNANEQGKFGFSRTRGLSRKERKQKELDAGIAEKQSREDAGERVVYTRREKARMKQLDKLRKEEKRLDREDRRQSSRQRQRGREEREANARQQLYDATGEAASAAGRAGKALDLMNRTRNPEDVRKRLENRAMNGVSDKVDASTAYVKQLEQLHQDLRDLSKRFFVVK